MAVILRPATDSDFPSIVTLMNSAFRGAEGWSIEGDLIKGQRTNASLISEETRNGAFYLLAKNDETSALDGCVSLQKSSPEKWYLGSLTVTPALQNAGFGRKLLDAAENYAAARGAETIEITVVSVRETLIAWYERRAYQRTGERRPFPYTDTRYGTPTRTDLEFIVLEKHLGA